MSEDTPSVQASRAAHESARANTIAVSNTKLVACLDALGFPSDCAPAQNVSTGKTVREFMVKPRSIEPLFVHLRLDIVRRYDSGVLEASEPMHPLCVMMRAQHNYDRVIDMHKGVVMNLRSIPGARMTIYRRCAQPDPLSNFSPEKIQITNLALVAALAGVGIPVLAFDGPEGGRRYTLPRFGYALQRADGSTYLEDAAQLVSLAPTPRDPHQLLLAEGDPLHPVVLGYNALRSRIRLRDLLQRKAPRLHVQDAGLQAMLTANHTGRVIDEVTRRFGAPPL